MTSRLKVLKQRAARGRCAAVKCDGGWYAVSGVGFGDCYGPLTRREAIYLAANWGRPNKKVQMYINGVRVE